MKWRSGKRRSPGPLSPLAPNLTARAATASGSTAGAVTVLYGVALALFILGVVWSQYVPALDEAADNFPNSTRLELGRLTYEGPDLIALSNHPRLLIALSNDPDITPEEFSDLTILLSPETVRFRFPFGEFSFRYPVDWRAEATDEGLSGAWDPWRIAFLGSVFIGALISMLIFWAGFAGLYTIPVFALGAMVFNKELTLPGSWRLCLVSLILGGVLGTAGFIAYSFALIDPLILILLLPGQLIFGWVWIGLALLCLPGASAKDFRPNKRTRRAQQAEPPTGGPSLSNAKSRKRNPFG